MAAQASPALVPVSSPPPPPPPPAPVPDPTESWGVASSADVEVSRVAFALPPPANDPSLAPAQPLSPKLRRRSSVANGAGLASPELSAGAGPLSPVSPLGSPALRRASSTPVLLPLSPNEAVSRQAVTSPLAPVAPARFTPVAAYLPGAPALPRRLSYIPPPGEAAPASGSVEGDLALGAGGQDTAPDGSNSDVPPAQATAADPSTPGPDPNRSAASKIFTFGR